MSDREHGMAVVGAGLVGSLTALLLANRGHHVDVYERRRDPRKVGDAAGRSINLALSERGWRALEKAGAVEAVRSIAMPAAGFQPQIKSRYGPSPYVLVNS